MIMGSLVAVALVLACLGAGGLILTSPGPGTRPHADGVAGLTGLALLTWLAGWLVFAGTYSATAGWLLLGLGGSMLVLSLARGGAEPSRALRSSSGGMLGALVLALLSLTLAMSRTISEFAVPIANLNDDLPGYWHFPRLLLESGGFVEPFNARRLTTLGAAPFAQSFFWRDFTIAAPGITDSILGQLLLWAVARAIPNAVSKQPQPAWRGEALALAALVASFTLPRENAMPTLLPMGGALVLILLTQRVTESDNAAGGIRAALAWGLVAAWLIGLRISNAPFPAMLWLVGAFVAARNKDQPQVFRLVVAAVATVVGLLPWNLALWRSSGTPLFPVIEGNYHLQESFPAPLDVPGVLEFIGSALWANHAWIIAIVGCLAATRPRTRQLSLQVMASLLALVSITAAMADMGRSLDSFSVHRYTAPFMAAGVIFLAGVILLCGTNPSTAKGARRWQLQPLLLFIALTPWLMIRVPLSLGQQDLYWVSNFSVIWDSAVSSLRNASNAWRSGLAVREWPGRTAYEAAQASLPASAKLVSATETPFLFRFDRQPIHTLDIPGLVSPAPGMPSFEGPERIAAYLRGLGYTHLAFTPPDASTGLYSPAQWTHLASYSLTYRNWARYFLTFLENEERLARSYAVSYESPEIIVLDLRRPL